MSSGQSFAAVATRFAFGTGRAPPLCVDDSNETLEPGHDIRARTFEFACRVVEFCKKLYEQGGVARQMAPQLINCSTSVAAILEEARGAESRRDFISKCSIGLKEARESHVRLRVCQRAALGPPGRPQLSWTKPGKSPRSSAPSSVTVVAMPALR